MSKPQQKPVAAPTPAPAPEDKTVPETEQTQSNTPNAENTGTDDKTGAEQGTPEQAPEAQAGERGETTSTVHVDESPFQKEPEVKAADLVTSATVQETTPVANNTAEQDDDQAELDRILKDVPQAHHYNAQRVLQYIREMATHLEQSPSTLKISQRALLKALTNTINLEEQYFREVFTAIVSLFNRHANGVFHDVYLNRGILEGTVNFTSDELNAFTRLTTMIKVLGPVKGRAAARQRIDLNGALKYSLTEPGRDRVREFFGPVG